MEQTVHLPLDREQHIKGNFLSVFVSRENISASVLWYIYGSWKGKNLTMQEAQC